MSGITRTAQIFSFIAAVIFWHGASIDARPIALFTATEASGIETAAIQVMPEPNSETGSEDTSLLQLASFSSGQSERNDKSTPVDADPFNLPTMTTLPNDISEKWMGLQSRLVAEEQILAGCRTDKSACPAAARRLLSIVELGRYQQGRALFGRINRAVNLAIRPMSDWAQYGVADYWATPLETLSRGAGDCEDYAIVKYVALRQFGIDPDNLRLVIVRDMKGQNNHAILAVHHEKNWLILDNRTLVMVATDMAQYYYPLFVLDQRGIRTFVTTVASR